ncbi:MAG: C13 family peptidase [Candidatus Hermodarchaeota archaeon]
MVLSKEIEDKIKKDALARITKRDKPSEDVNLYLFTDEITVDQKIIAGSKAMSIPRKTALVFADMAPRCNWGHPCQHMLYDAETGEMYKKEDTNFPPKSFFTNAEKYKAIHIPVKRIDVVKKRKSKVQPVKRKLIKSKGNRYAILFSGMSDNRHVNDIEFLYRTLIDVYGFKTSKIYVLNFDGTINYSSWGPHPVENWPGDNTPYRMKVNDKGTKIALEKVLDKLATILKEEDELLIHMNNHGSGPPYDPESNLCCYPENEEDWYDAYNASEFGEKLKTLPKFTELIVVMEQCHSGGFNKPIIDNSPAKKTHVCAACEEDKSSIGGANFDPFALDWIAGVTGHYPGGTGLEEEADTNQDELISANEAFDYANAVHDPYDTPVSKDKPEGSGSKMFLGLGE